MDFHADHHFVIGRTHISGGTPCQDHALSAAVQYRDIRTPRYDYAFAIVSDGCSSAGQTDIGSRLITTATAKEIKHLFSFTPKSILDFPHSIYNHSKFNVIRTADFLGLDERDLLATQLFAAINYNGEGFVSVYGDGTVAFVNDNGTMSVFSFEWNNNTPFYPLYKGDTFEKAHGGLDKPALTIKTYTFGDGEETETQITHTVESGSHGITLPVYAMAKLALICLFTDGVHQVDKVPFIEVVKSLTSFKNTSGLFVKRRMIRFVADSQKIGHGPLDDLAMAVISIHRT